MPREEYKSKRFKSFEDIQKYFKNCEESPLIDAIRFLAEELEITQERLESLDNEYRDYYP